MSIYQTLFILLITITTFAEHIKPGPPHIIGGLTPSTATGDVLNTTRCYCASPDWKTDHTFGYYFLFTYYNFHHDSVYSFDTWCHSDKYRNVHLPVHDDRVQPECLRVRSHERFCTTEDNKGNRDGQFCYELNGGSMSDYYYFNEQKRGLPWSTSYRASEEELSGVCGEKCKDIVGGLDVLGGEALESVVADKKGVGPSEWSAVLSFGDTDDMCETCKK